SYLQALRPLALYIMVGLMGTGKTQAAEALASHWGLPVISSDVVRKELAGIPAMEHRYEEFGRGLYAEEVSRRTYEELFRRAGGLLHQGRSVILDASFRKEALRREAQRVAQAAGAEPWLIECTASEPATRKRLEQRLREPGITSDGRWEIFRQQRMAFEPVEASPAQGHLLLDTLGPPEETAFRLLKSLYAGILQRGDQS
ncbi:MAG: AAA family ATPase, partial [Dehalococcoidia bacterium]